MDEIVAICLEANLTPTLPYLSSSTVVVVLMLWGCFPASRAGALQTLNGTMKGEQVSRLISNTNLTSFVALQKRVGKRFNPKFKD